MEYVNLGNTGLRVSRVCLGMMSFGAHPERPWALTEADSEPIIRRAVEGGITFFDTADVYNGGESEVVTGRVLPKLLSPRGARDRDEGARADDAGRERPSASPASTSWPRSTPRCSGSGSTTSTSTRSTAGIPRRRSRRRWRRSTTSSRPGKARYIGASSMFAWQFAKAQAAADRSGDDALRLDAEPLQPRLPRGGAGDDPAVHRPGRRRAPVEPARARAARRQPHPRGREADDARGHRPVRRLALRPRRRLRRRRPGRRGRRRARRSRRAGGARLADRSSRA